MNVTSITINSLKLKDRNILRKRLYYRPKYEQNLIFFFLIANNCIEYVTEQLFNIKKVTSRKEQHLR